MSYFVAPGRTITSQRGIIQGGDSDSQVSWKDFCRDQSDKKVVTIAKDQIKRLEEAGAIVSAESMPMTRTEIDADTEREKITQHSTDLSRVPELRGRKKQGVKARQVDSLKRMAELSKKSPVEQTVDLSGDDAGDGDGDGVQSQSVALSEGAEKAEKAEAEKAEKAGAKAEKAEKPSKAGAKAGAEKAAADPLAAPGGGD